MAYISKEEEKIFFKEKSLIFFIQIDESCYNKILADNKSWDKAWVDSFGKNGFLGYEWMYLNIEPCIQPRQLRWFIDEHYSLKKFDLDRTAIWNKAELYVLIDQKFGNFKTLKKSLLIY